MKPKYIPTLQVGGDKYIAEDKDKANEFAKFYQSIGKEKSEFKINDDQNYKCKNCSPW